MLNYGYANTIFGNTRTGGKLIFTRVTCEKCSQFTLVQASVVGGMILSQVCGNINCGGNK
jgi:hypothetical protein